MYNFDFKKTLGQNFLKDDNIVNKIVNATEYKKNNLVIEIGPGAGSLTKKLLPKVDKAILYEIDTRLERILNKELAEYDNYTIIFDDFLNRN
ncbi:rRNA adenine N-6-methyltransferase family protein, partial [Klebsiella pneumoniae]|uniref:rRNA adenine N-6-methyltransferase family protein n=1 Tax=Klebsiella pneumoniae TaxID=573 RepID=UPI0034E96A40